MIIEVVGFVFSIFVLSRVFLRFREGKISAGMFLVWTAVWFAVIVFIIDAESFTSLSNIIGIQRPLDLALIAGLILCYYLMFRIYVAVEDIRSDIAKVARQVALSEKEK